MRIFDFKPWNSARGSLANTFSTLMAVLSVAILPVAIIGASARLHAQTSSGTVTGVVTDPGGAVIVGAKVEVEPVFDGLRLRHRDEKKAR